MITTNYISIKTKEAFVKEDYTLKSPYFFIVLNILAILCGAILLKSEINLITFIVYALPITLGLYFEIKHIRIYNTLDLGIEKIRKLLNISTIILANCILFISSFFLILGNKIIENILLKASYSNSINFSDLSNNRN